MERMKLYVLCPILCSILERKIGIEYFQVMNWKELGIMHTDINEELCSKITCKF